MEGTLGEIRIFAGSFAPRYWAFCHGQTLSIAQNQALFSILGAHYGGDAQTTFNLPDLKGKGVSDANGFALQYIICIEGAFPYRS
jgi:microcystin-dependent protein